MQVHSCKHQLDPREQLCGSSGSQRHDTIFCRDQAPRPCLFKKQDLQIDIVHVQDLQIKKCTITGFRIFQFIKFCPMILTSIACARSMSPFQESAQYLAGREVPQQVLGSLLSKAKVGDGSVVGLINLSPYDTWLELTAHEWVLEHNGTCMPTLSLSKSLSIIEYCQRSLALKLLDDTWPSSRV